MESRTRLPWPKRPANSEQRFGEVHEMGIFQEGTYAVHMGVSIVMGYHGVPQMDGSKAKTLAKMDELGVTRFQETPIWLLMQHHTEIIFVSMAYGRKNETARHAPKD